MFQKISVSTLFVQFVMVALFPTILTGCGSDKAVDVFGQLQAVPTNSTPAGPNTTPATGGVPASLNAAVGANNVPVTSFETNVQTFYYNFSAIDAEKIDYRLDGVMSACPADPVLTISLVDFESGSEVVVRNL